MIRPALVRRRGVPRRGGFALAGLLALALFVPRTARAGAPDPRRSLVVAAVERAKGAVVNVATEQYVRSRVPGPAGTLFDQFFRDFYEPPRAAQKLAVNSLGSGVIFDSHGDVLTNFHVIARGARIMVGLADGRQLQAEVVGTDPESDVAVLRVNAPNLPAAVLGTSKDLMEGETAIAIGNPFGLSHTVTTGVVSALHRSVRAEGRSFYDFIQTDAAINPGNSGGPLLNINGEVVGINTAIYAEGHGIGFAIPVDRARLLAEEILGHGQVRESWLGLSVKAAGDDAGGVTVSDVEPGSPASKAGVRPGDRVLTFNGTQVLEADEFRYLLRGIPVGNAAELKVGRGPSQVALAMTTAEYPVAAVTDLLERRLGLQISEVALARERGGARGLVIRAIRAGSPAAQVGLQTGDRVRAVNSLEVGTLDDFRRAVRRARHGGSAILLIQRGRSLEQVEFPL